MKITAHHDIRLAAEDEEGKGYDILHVRAMEGGDAVQVVELSEVLTALDARAAGEVLLSIAEFARDKRSMSEKVRDAMREEARQARKRVEEGDRVHASDCALDKDHEGSCRDDFDLPVMPEPVTPDAPMIARPVTPR